MIKGKKAEGGEMEVFYGSTAREVQKLAWAILFRANL